MNKQPTPEQGNDDNPEWTEEDFAQARPAAKVLPKILGRKNADALMTRSRGQRGPQKAPTKHPVSIRLSAEVVDYFKASGKGWHSRMDAVLRDYVKSHK